ncbi:uncharacterized protein LOC127987458 [Carassius gibelio]|uniref:uncharacterized protein LOC127987458 n=1 Tax=Carassius gibelio TaxID=101364 RepID=UPI002278332D|nr:uncharacterized protein LOC127987458 [Carassius gibelio]
MSEDGQSAKCGKENIKDTVQSSQQLESQECVDTQALVAVDDTTEQEPRRSQRARKFTEKGKELHDERLTKLKNSFQRSYEKWKTLARDSRQRLMGHLSSDMLNSLIDAISGSSKDVNVVYEELRQNVNPDSDTRRRVDTCGAVTKMIVESAWSRLGEGVKGQDPLRPEACCIDTGSVFSSIAPKSSHGHSRSSQSMKNSILSSRGSSFSSAKKQEAAAEIAATEATLEILQQQEHELEELQRLEAEDKRRIAEQEAEELKRRLEREEEEARLRVKIEAENAARRKALEDKRRELERLETLKRLNAARARMQVYEQNEDSKEETRELLRDCASVRKKHVPKLSSSVLQSIPLQEGATKSYQEASTADLVKVLAESISSSRLPIPEPATFYGDSLRFSDWKISFQTLIDRKNIPVNEKLYYLRKYVEGPANKAIESYFLLGTESAYQAAWGVLEERYGNPFVIAKAFRDKLNSWPKIGSKDSVELREFTDFLRGCEAAMSQIKGLEILNDCNENQKILSKLPDWLASAWNRQVIEIEEETKTFPTFSRFVKFLTREAKIACNPVTSLHALKPNEIGKGKISRNQDTRAKVLTVQSRERVDAVKCTFCERLGHSIHKCRKFMEKNVAERVKFVQMNKLCFGCLNPGHHSKNCEDRSVCEKCQKKHPSCLHEDRIKEAKRTPQSGQSKEKLKERNPELVQNKDSVSEVTSNRVIQDVNNTHTSTIVPVWVSATDEPTHEVLVYALLDTQSDTTFILEEIAQALDTKKESVQLKLSTMVSKSTVVPCQKIIGLKVRGFYSEKKISLPVTYSREFIPANRTHIPTPKTARVWPHLMHIAEKIAPKQVCDIGLLIGYNCPQALLPREIVSGKENQPFAQRTDLGWSIVGCGNSSVDYGDAIGVSHRIIVKQVLPSLQSSLNLTSKVQYICRTQIKEVITPPNVIKALESDFNEKAAVDSCISQEDLRFLSKMETGIRHKEDGHYEMPLPFKEDRPNLPNNKGCAIHRLKSLEKRLKRDEKYYRDYVDFMNETIARGDAEKVPAEETDKIPAWYIPHHGVYHPQKPEKIRVVFDCSAKFQGSSLNDHLLTGPELTNTLVGVLCRFRKGPVAIMCDIERMFHQFHVKEEDQDYLRFLWWEKGDLESKPQVYRMKVHLFGAASSPGCANYGLKHIAAQGRGCFSESSIRFIERNFYVDDGLTSVSTVDEAIKLMKEARELCSTGKLRLHKFVSSSEEVKASIPLEECAKSVMEHDLALGELHMERALGVKWCIKSDSFQFRVFVKEQPLTRRGILSTVASVYDPLGFAAPLILVGKQILQQMCQDKVGWDEPLKEELLTKWKAWLTDLRNLADVKIQRCYLPSTFKEVQRYELHHFSDASTSGYGECTYLRAISISGDVHCSLVMAKARVASSKVTTIPRLELSAAVVAVQTSDLLRKELDIANLEEYFWTDSKVVLGYINNDAKRFHIFVANRIQRIKQSTDTKQWRYVTSKENPADHASRGLTSEELISSNWFTGPRFLWKDELPSDVKVGEIIDNDPELRKAQVHKTQAKEERSLLDRLQKFSDWTRVVKAIARLKRCSREVKGLSSRVNEATSIEERQDAELTVIRMVQQSAFCDEIQRLRQQKEIESSTNKLHRLNPFLDEHGILRVGGRLVHAALHPHVKHPAILPRHSHISTLLIRHYHEQVYHQGRGMTINELRSNGFWILGCSKAVSSYIYKCTRCRKLRRCTEEQRMANLPQERMETTPPFTYCGMDCFGPFYVKEGRKELKRYGLLLTCMCSRAIHVEMLDDLSTDAFINALRAFIAIRGPVRQLRSDQGTNFVGARREFAEALKEINQERLKEFGCEFIMNTPSASHMGGIWERQIRTIRSVLTSILDQSAQRLDSASLRTFLYEVMAIVNSRPLTTEHLNDPSGPQPLTPNHILTMKTSIILPPPGEFVKEDLYLHKRWRKVQYLANEFWSRWKKEYLLNLQHRQKWHKHRRNVKVNDIVILKDDTAPRSQWKLAKVTEVHSGTDGCVRTVKLLISDSTLDKKGKRVTKPTYLERPIQKIVTLIEAD